MATIARPLGAEERNPSNEIAGLSAGIMRDAQRILEALVVYERAIDASLKTPSASVQCRDPEAICVDDARRVAGYLRARRKREGLFPEGLFADPAWDILLDLFVATVEGRHVSISSACIAASVPPTTALRRIGSLERRGLIRRSCDPKDARRIWVSLESSARQSINMWLDCMWPLVDGA